MCHLVIVGNDVMVQTNDARYSLTEYYGINYKGCCYVDGKAVRFVVRGNDIQFMCHFTETAKQIIQNRKVVLL